MKTIKVTMFMDVTDDFADDGACEWESHIDWLLSLDEYPEIESVYGVEVNTVDDAE